MASTLTVASIQQGQAWKEITSRKDTLCDVVEGGSRHCGQGD